jgi:dTMP kinase
MTKAKHPAVKKGIFLSFEGIDGCGKSTQIRLLSTHLEEKGFSVLLVREPGGCIISEKIRDILLHKAHLQMSISTEHLLYWAARAQLVEEVISPALEQGKIVLADRFGWSTYAYQGYGRGMSLKDIDYLRKLVCGEVWPHHSFLLDISLEEMKKRTRMAAKEPDRMESQADNFFERIRKGYLSLAKENPRSFTILDGSGKKEEINGKIITRVNRLIDAEDLENL